MIKFEHTNTYNWESAIRGIRNPLEAWDKSDSVVDENGVTIGPTDLKVMKAYLKAGDQRSKFLRHIVVSVDIIAPLFWFKEMDTYKVGTVCISTSTMDTLGKKPFTEDMFSFEDTPNEVVENYLETLNTLRQDWIDAGKRKPSKEWRAMNQMLASSFNYRRTMTLNYQVLRSIYHIRKNDRLSEWKDMCEWIESLPYSEEFITCD